MLHRQVVLLLLLASTIAVSSFTVTPRRSDSVGQPTVRGRLHFLQKITTAIVASTIVFAPTISPDAFAVSGGGKDYANKDLREEDFSGKSEKGKDFTQCDASSVKFRNAELSGTRFFRAKLVNTDFTGANLVSSSLEDTDLAGAIFEDANLQGAYFSVGIADAASLSGADFTDAQMPDFAMKKLCQRTDIDGTNKKTGAVTKDTLFCP
jgi:uncharacterized protein YjbI with pentapeptide repeats